MVNNKNGTGNKIVIGVCIMVLGCSILHWINTASDSRVQAQLIDSHNIRIKKCESRDEKLIEDISQIKGDIRVLLDRGDITN